MWVSRWIHLSASNILICFWTNFARMATSQASLPFSFVRSPRLVIDFMLLHQCFCYLAQSGLYWMHPIWSRLCKVAGHIEQGSIRPNDLHMRSCSHYHCPASFASVKFKSKWALLATSCMFPSRIARLSSLRCMMM